MIDLVRDKHILKKFMINADAKYIYKYMDATYDYDIQKK